MLICKRIEDFAKEIREKELKKESEENLKQLLEELCGMVSDFWNYCMFTEMSDAGYDIEDIEKENKKFGFSKEEIQLLVTPAKQGYLTESKRLLFSLAESFTEEKEKDFLEKFFWIKNDYAETGEYGGKDLREEIAGLKKTEWRKEKEELENYSRKIKERQEIILRENGLAENPFWFYNELTFWRDERKRYNYMSLFAATQIALEVLKRKGMQKYLNVIMPSELFSLPKKSELDRRKKNGMLLFISGEKIVLYSKPDAEKKFRKITAVQYSKGDLRGMGASIGTATGRAKIILSPKDFRKMEHGDILVASTTRPDYVPIMKKAAAIVTNEGGITCHAAIVARELGIPCVVGAKIATKIFKDGDLVEVRANHGLVRKL